MNKKGTPGNLKPYKPGQSGNPGGRPKQDEEVMEILRAAAPAAARKLVKLMMGDDQLAHRAAESVLNRVMGTPRQQVEVQGDGVTFVMRLPSKSATAEEWEQEAAQLTGRQV